MREFQKIIDLLRLERWGDAFILNGVLYANLPPDGTLSDTEVSISEPLSENWRRKIETYAEPIEKEKINCLYSLCNGLRVGSRYFGLYAFITPDSHGSATRLNIDVPNIHERPKFIPPEDLIVGFSEGERTEEGTLRFYHVISARGQVYAICRNRPDRLLREYQDITQWLTAEFELAISKPQNCTDV
jgi:hypothetical protein